MRLGAPYRIRTKSSPKNRDRWKKDNTGTEKLQPFSNCLFIRTVLCFDLRKMRKARQGILECGGLPPLSRSQHPCWERVFQRLRRRFSRVEECDKENTTYCAAEPQEQVIFRETRRQTCSRAETQGRSSYFIKTHFFVSVIFPEVILYKYTPLVRSFPSNSTS